MAGVYNQAVIDASFVLGFLLPDERSGAIDDVFDRFVKGKLTLSSCPLLPFEVLNGLVAAVAQKRLSVSEAKTLAYAFLNMEIPAESVTYEEAFQLAVDKKLSLYDASYAWLALDKGVPLLTFDAALARVMKRAR